MQPIVVIGTGLAGYGVAREFRKHDRHTPLILITRDDGASYYKPDLSEALTKGNAPEDLVKKPAARMAEELDIEVRADSEVSDIDTGARTVTVNGEALAYTKLVLANGASQLSVPLGGDAVADVHHVNSLADYRVFRRDLNGARRVLIIGAGLIGCEFANDLANAGIAVDSVDPVDWPLQRLLPEEAGRALQSALAEQGVQWHLGDTVSSVERDGDGFRVSLSGGGEVSVDLVLSAVGLRPNTALAEAAGLRTATGVSVDRHLRSSDPQVYALGDVAEVEGQFLPFVMPLMNAARALGRTLAGEDTPVRYPVMPVTVKTPACPVIVYPPRGAAGQWQVAGEAPSLEARYVDAAGNLIGYALTGEATGKRGQYMREAPPVLG
ncbi:FAD-dependent oxidoreductase [Ectothiorhodospiraceae bacterium WFHF3C12]|nr:FAD-dependent oxidoreductase [Ectothiorhodospiraceae bacterium WFHF3C12]